MMGGWFDVPYSFLTRRPPPVDIPPPAAPGLTLPPGSPFAVGEHARCVNARWIWFPDGAPSTGPALGAVVVITATLPARGAVNVAGWGEQWFHFSAFWPVGDREMEALRRLAAAPNEVPVRELAGART